MATLIPAIGSVLSRMTSGERRFAERLERHLEDDYLCWYDVPVGEQGLHPDFVVLHPRRGLLILEVKDWRLDTIQRISRQAATIITNNGIKQVTSPMEQARRYAHAVVQQLEGDPQLTFPSKHRYAGRLLVPWGYGVVLANITRRQFEQQSDLDAVFPRGRVICQDEMTASVDPESFQSQLWGMFRHVPEQPLSLPQIDRIRWHMFPEVRIQQGSLFDPSPDKSAEKKEVAATIPDIIRVMDLKQEQLARSLGSGHRIIHGAAGAGKTLILVYRCLHLARALRKPILVLCYNKTLAARLQAMMDERGLGSSVHVRNFHKWCREQCVAYHVPLPKSGDAFPKELVERVIEATGKGLIPPAQYGAVMIDEGHDFESHWLTLAVQMVDPETDSVLVLYDDAQSIYGRSKNKFTFSSVGIQARGRTTILRINYRNTDEIIRLATGFAREILDPKEAEEDGIPLVAPKSAGRRGPPPRLIQLPNLTREAEYVARNLHRLQREKGYEWSAMAVVSRARFIADTVARELERCGIPVVAQNKAKPGKSEAEVDAVRMLTMHSSKGLEFPVVAIPGIGYLPFAKSEESEEARLMYVAMTRSLEHLIMTGHRPSSFIQKLEALSDTKGQIAGQDHADKANAEEVPAASGPDKRRGLWS